MFWGLWTARCEGVPEPPPATPSLTPHPLGGRFIRYIRYKAGLPLYYNSLERSGCRR
jgi:hypothetical protein